MTACTISNAKLLEKSAIRKYKVGHRGNYLIQIYKNVGKALPTVTFLRDKTFQLTDSEGST